MKLICLTAISLSSCAYNPKKLTPTFIDTDRGTCREYHVTQTKPTVEFAFTAEFPIAHCNGYLSLPLEQALEIKRYYEESIHPKSLPPENSDPLIEKIMLEINNLSGVVLDKNTAVEIN